MTGPVDDPPSRPGRSRRGFLKTSTQLAALAGAGAARAKTVRLNSPGADLILRGGKVHTQDPRNPVARAVAVRGRTILAVGSDQNVGRHLTRRTKVIDLGGRTVTPGLIDAHAHLPYFGLRESGFWVNLQRLTDKDRILARLADRARRTPAGEWIHAWGIESIDLNFVTRADLDRISRNHPILALHTGGQWGVANTLALQRAKITKNTASPPGGRIVKDISGRPTGLLIHYPAINLVRRYVPRPTAAQRRQVLAHAGSLYARNGVTSVHDNFCYVFDQRFQRTYFELAAANRLPVQVRLWPYLPNLAAAVITVDRVFNRLPAEWVKRAESALAGFYRMEVNFMTRALDKGLAECRRSHDRFFSKMWGGFKLAVDGGGPTAMWYQNRGRAKALHQRGQLFRMIRFLHTQGHSISVHAVGDEAVDWIVDAFGAALGGRPAVGRRHRIEHALSPTPGAVDKMRRLGLGVCHHPQWFWDWGHKFVRLDSSQWSWARGRPILPSRTFLKNNIPLAFGADPPAHSEYRPQVALFEALVRRNKQGYHFGGDQTLSIQQALMVQTRGGAFLAGEEKDKGAIEPGKQADLAVWDTDLLSAKPDRIREAKALLTLCAGRVTHRAGI
jgi:predicted amidohydrolase YtcJ